MRRASAFKLHVLGSDTKNTDSSMGPRCGRGLDLDRGRLVELLFTRRARSACKSRSIHEGAASSSKVGVASSATPCRTKRGACGVRCSGCRASDGATPLVGVLGSWGCCCCCDCSVARCPWAATCLSGSSYRVSGGACSTADGIGVVERGGVEGGSGGAGPCTIDGPRCASDTEETLTGTAAATDVVTPPAGWP